MSRALQAAPPVLVLLIWVLACSQAKPPASNEPALSVTAEELARAHQANELAAEQKYKPHVLRVSGTIDGIGEDVLGSPYLTFVSKDTTFGVQAMFPRESASQLAALSKGRPITLRCRWKGKLMGVLLDSCAIEK